MVMNVSVFIMVFFRDNLHAKGIQSQLGQLEIISNLLRTNLEVLLGTW